MRGEWADVSLLAARTLGRGARARFNMADKYELNKCSYVFRGSFVHSTSKNVMEILQDKIIGISPSGKVCMLDEYCHTQTY